MTLKQKHETKLLLTTLVEFEIELKSKLKSFLDL